MPTSKQHDQLISNNTNQRFNTDKINPVTGQDWEIVHLNANSRNVFL
jgi:hypothetical protein